MSTAQLDSVASKLVAYWTLGEAPSSVRVDAVGGFNAVEGADPVPQGTGLITPKCAEFTGADEDYLVASDPAGALSLSGESAIFGWTRLSSLSATADQVVAKWPATGAPTFSDLSWAVQFLGGAANYFRILVSPDGGDTSIFVTGDPGQTIVVDTWYFWSFEHNPGSTIRAETNLKPLTHGYSSGIHVGSGDLWFGSDEATNNWLDGRVNGVGITDGLLTSGEKAALYNAGAGVDLRAYLPAQQSGGALIHLLSGGLKNVA